MRTIKQQLRERKLYKGLNLTLLIFFLFVLLQAGCKPKKSMRDKKKTAPAMRYIKTIQSTDRTIDFTYDEQQRILSATEKRQTGNADVYTYIYKENSIQINWNGKQKAMITSEPGAPVNVEVQEGNMKVKETYGIDGNWRILQSSTGVVRDICDFTWKDGNLDKVKGGYSECTYQYGEKENKPVNIDIVNCLTNIYTPYPWYYCAFAWGQSKQLPVSISNYTGEAKYNYEFDDDGYIVKVKEKMAIEMEYGTDVSESEYIIVYCD